MMKFCSMCFVPVQSQEAWSSFVWIDLKSDLASIIEHRDANEHTDLEREWRVGIQ
jgi:hypothetical protein